MCVCVWCFCLSGWFVWFGLAGGGAGRLKRRVVRASIIVLKCACVGVAARIGVDHTAYADATDAAVANTASRARHSGRPRLHTVWRCGHPHLLPMPEIVRALASASFWCTHGPHACCNADNCRVAAAIWLYMHIQLMGGVRSPRAQPSCSHRTAKRPCRARARARASDRTPQSAPCAAHACARPLPSAPVRPQHRPVRRRLLFIGFCFLFAGVAVAAARHPPFFLFFSFLLASRRLR